MSYTDPQGTIHPTSYWRIEQIDTDFIIGEARVYFAGYPTEALKLAGKRPFPQRQVYTFAIVPSTLPEDAAGRAKVYLLAKAGDPFFVDAVRA